MNGKLGRIHRRRPFRRRSRPPRRGLGLALLASTLLGVGCGGGGSAGPSAGRAPAPAEPASGEEATATAPSTSSASSDGGDHHHDDDNDDRMLAPNPAPATIQVTSGAFDDAGTIPGVHAFDGFGCTGQNTSPPLAWTEVPEGTKSFALVVHDPDAPTGVGFFHWVAFDIPADTRSLPAGASGDGFPGTEGHTDYGATGYGGPCPPPGDDPHRYLFTVYALDTERIGLGPPATGALTRFVLGQHTLALGRLTGTYARPGP